MWEDLGGVGGLGTWALVWLFPSLPCDGARHYFLSLSFPTTVCLLEWLSLWGNGVMQPVVLFKALMHDLACHTQAQESVTNARDEPTP